MRKPFVKNIRNIVIKVGTSVLTKNGGFDRAIIADLTRQISSFFKTGVHVSLVSSGAIGAGMTILKMRRRPKTMEGLQAAAAAGQRYLMQCYEGSFSKHGFSTAQVLLTWDDLASEKRFMNAKRALREIQRLGLVPIINENDTVATDEIRFGDNDRLSALLSILTQADLLVVLSDTNGLYRSGARDDEDRPAMRRDRIQIVEKIEESLFSHVRDKNSSFTVGGMRSKLEAARMCVNAGIPVFLADGRDKRVLTRLFDGEDLGTFFLPHRRRAKGENGWIAQFLRHVEKRKG